jgi:DNA modification methylase
MTELNSIIFGDCRESMHRMTEEGVRVQTCVTSPPYFGLRSYLDNEHEDKNHEIGSEKTPEEFIANLVDVFRHVKELLHDNGTLWVNIGDSYIANKTGGLSEKPSLMTGGRKTQEIGSNRPNKKPFGEYKNKDLIGIPWMLAFALRADGWYLRQEIIWAKKNCMPESVTDRCTKSHEQIFLLSKQPRYYFDNEAIKEPVAESTIGRGKVSFGGKKGRDYKENIDVSDPNFRNGSEQWGRVFDYKESCINGRNKRSVWNVGTNKMKLRDDIAPERRSYVINELLRRGLL